MHKKNKHIKIAFVTAHNAQDRRSWSGTIYFIAQALQKHCGEVTYIGPIDTSREKLIGRITNKLAGIFLKRGFFYDHCFSVAKKCAKVASQRLAEQSFDVIVAPSGETDIAFLETDIPIVLVEDATYSLLHDYYPEYSHLLKRSFYEMNTLADLAIKKADLLIYSSDWAARSAIEDYAADPRKIHVVPFGANLEQTPTREVALGRTKSERCRLLFVGVDWYRKGGDIAFETMLKLKELGIQAELLVCGCIPPPQFSDGRMRVIPFLDKNDERQRKELEQLYQAADFLLLPTRSECYGIVFCEANAFGLPVITTNTGGVLGVIRDSENGVLLPYSARGDAYAQVIANLYRDDEQYRQLVRGSRAAFEERLNWDAWGRAVRELLVDLLGYEMPIETFSKSRN